MYLIFLATTTTIIAFLATGIININSNFENAFSQGDSEIPPLVEPDKNITIMNIDKKHQPKPMSILK